MGTLHWVAFPPERQDLLHQLLALLEPADAVLFDGAGLAFLRHQRGLAHFSHLTPYCLEEHHQGCKTITAQQLAELSMHYKNTITWYP
ncbi:MAG TPA: hypothetical protein VK099_08275 [Alcanivoracaceae bacterium]|nr:hypothetical protein [Alcanivoracaceae bacterium]